MEPLTKQTNENLFKESNIEEDKNTLLNRQPPIRRELDSVDDFEHLEHDSSPLKDNEGITTSPPLLHELGGQPINIGVGIKKTAENQITDVAIDHPQFEQFNIKQQQQTSENLPPKMDSNLVEIGESYPVVQDDERKIDKMLEDISDSLYAPIQPQKPLVQDFDGKNFGAHKDATKDFLSFERKEADERLEQYFDNDIEDDFKPSKYENFPKAAELPESESTDFKQDNYKDVLEFEPEITRKLEPESPIIDDNQVLIDSNKEKIDDNVKSTLNYDDSIVKDIESEKSDISSKESSIGVNPLKVSTVQNVVEKAVSEPKPVKDTTCQIKNVVDDNKKNLIAAEAIFCNMGLDTWFHPERLNPKVESLIYWRDPKKSGPIFGGVLLVLLALTYFSFISVIAYLSLLGLVVTISFRIYKNIVQAVQKTADGHPLKEYLECDVALPQERVQQITEVAVAHLNAGILELRRLFLVEDLVDSVKFGVFLWTLTYLGAWFNGMTLIIIAWVALFTLPKVYETNKTQIDANLEIVRTKLAEITSKVKAAIPIGKKPEEKKEQ